MNTLFVTHGSELYGANLSLLGLIDGLAGSEITCSVLTPWAGDLMPALQERKVACHQLHHEWWLSYQFNLIHRIRRLRLNLGRLDQAEMMARAAHIDVVYSNTSVISFGALLAHRLGVPHIWHLREFGDLDHGLRFDWGRAIHRWVISRATSIVCVSRAIRDHLVCPRAHRRTKVIYNGVLRAAEFDRYRKQRQSTAARSRPFTFVMAGAFRPGKQQDLAIRGLARLIDGGREARLLLLGDGNAEYLAHCRQVAADCGVNGRVEFRGYVMDPFPAYQEADAALMCSKFEGMGRVTVEGMAAALPVIGYAAGGTAELIEHEVTGLLFRDGEEELATLMARLVDRRDLARELGNNAWAHARQDFTIEKYANDVREALFSTLCIAGATSKCDR